jgi:very-short-patch-repair endonuclease
VRILPGAHTADESGSWMHRVLAVQGLRRRVVTLPLLHQTMEVFTWRRGNTLRRRLLHESRDQPWSQLERAGHNLMRRHRIVGWRANHRVRVRGHVFHIDIAIPALGLAIGLDGWSFHRTREDLERDAARHNWLQYAGWTVLRITSATLDEIPTWVRRFQTVEGAQPRQRITS